jgi:hypothetical protein
VSSPRVRPGGHRPQAVLRPVCLLIQRSSREHVTKRRPRLLSAPGVDPRSVQTAPCNRSNPCLRLPVVTCDPRDDRRKIGGLREQRGAFDDRTAGAVRTSKSLHQRTNFLIFHASHHTHPGKGRPRADEAGEGHLPARAGLHDGCGGARRGCDRVFVEPLSTDGLGEAGVGSMAGERERGDAAELA